MVTKKIMEKPPYLDLSKASQTVITGDNLLVMLKDTIFYECSKYIPKDEIAPQKKYLVYGSYGLTQNLSFSKEHIVIYYVEEIIPELTKEEQEKWEEVRINASISMMNALLETTQHSVVLEPAANAVYARVAVAYADSLIKELKSNKDWVEKILEV